MITTSLWFKFNDLLSGTILHPQYFIKRVEHRVVEEIKSQSKGGTFLDIGCGRQWYRPMLEGEFDSYLALDHPNISKKYKSGYPIEVKADVCQIPLANMSVDIASMIMVLEHLPDPERALKEVKRVLKAQGRLVICTVENYPGHDLPNNYYHFTKFGLEAILKRSGFSSVKIESFGNFWQTQIIYINVFIMQKIKRLAKGVKGSAAALILLVILAPLMVIGNLLALIVGGKRVDLEFALGYIARAK